MIEEKQMWEIINLVISENILEEESIKSMKAGDNIYLKYARILDHNLSRFDFYVDILLMRTLPIPTMRLVVKDLIIYLRCKEDEQ